MSRFFTTFTIMKTSRIRIVVLLGAFSIITIILFQVYWVYRTFDITESQFNQRVKIALYDVAERIADFNQSQVPYDPVKQVTSNYFVVNLEDFINPTILEFFLKSEFDKSNIHFDYEYAIYDCDTDEMVYGKYISQSPTGQDRSERTAEFRKQEGLVYYFGIIFPAKSITLLQSMNVWIISSLIIITALLFFSYAIFIILQQKKLSEIQRDFINNMTHEFKTPISTIAVASEVLSDPAIVKDPHRLLQYATIISEQNTRLKQQIEKILQNVSVEKKRIRLHLEEIDLTAVVRQLLNDIHVYYPGQAFSIRSELPDKQLVIMADRLHLINILINLIDNAIKYGGQEIAVSLQKRSGYALLAVEDNGPGIDRKYRNKIFQKFFRIPASEPTNIKGYGLGLFYVKNLITSHNWKIFVESEKGSGVRFVIQMKLKQDLYGKR